MLTTVLRSLFRRVGQVGLAACAVILAGCSTGVSPEELATADFGQFPSNYQDVIKSHMMAKMKDPMSAQYNFTKGPSKHKYGLGSMANYGYAVCAQINGKNAFGGYVGFRPFYFLIRNNQVIFSYGGNESADATLANIACSSVT